MTKNWRIKFTTTDGKFSDAARVTLQKIRSRSKFSYNLTMTMNDSVGLSNSKAILVHTGKGFGIQFEKTYANKKKAQQTGSFRTLLYKGIQNESG